MGGFLSGARQALSVELFKFVQVVVCLPYGPYFLILGDYLWKRLLVR